MSYPQERMIFTVSFLFPQVIETKGSFLKEKNYQQGEVEEVVEKLLQEEMEEEKEEEEDILNTDSNQLSSEYLGIIDIFYA